MDCSDRLLQARASDKGLSSITSAPFCWSMQMESGAFEANFARLG